MSIDQTVDQVTAAYANSESANIQIPTPLQAYEFASFALDYMSAAAQLDSFETNSWLPQLQLTGHAVECALKCYLAAATSEPPKATHDLIALCKDSSANGCEFEDRDIAAITHLSHFYFRDLTTKTKFKARYPSRSAESLGGAIPPNDWFIRIVNHLINNAASLVPESYATMFDSLHRNDMA